MYYTESEIILNNFYFRYETFFDNPKVLGTSTRPLQKILKRITSDYVIYIIKYTNRSLKFMRVSKEDDCDKWYQ